MKKIRKEALKLVEKVVKAEVDIDVYSWPPHCAGIFHQPKRPEIKVTKDSTGIARWHNATAVRELAPD